MRPLGITYDGTADAVYLYLLDPVPEGMIVETTAALDPTEIDGMINVDFDREGRMIGVEVLDARRFFTNAVIWRAESIVRNTGGESAPPLRITFDANADAAYLYLVDPVPEGPLVAATHELEASDEVVGRILFDFDRDGHLVGIEVRRASSTLTAAVLERAERI